GMVSVLNAFRHHRNFRPAASRVGVHREGLCSTPFGIIGIFAALLPTHLFATRCELCFQASLTFVLVSLFSIAKKPFFRMAIT
ncbi:MAG: hypothetical protein ACRD4L_01140, partial [Pyrinomonadaceae bacterium]